MMRRVIVILFIPFGLFGQYNLVANPSFENKSFYSHVIPNVSGSGGILDWFNPNASSPDYFSECAFPLASLQVPHTDSAYVGIATYDPLGSNQREYVSNGLVAPLIANQFYWVEFFASVGEGYTGISSNNLGIHFSDSALHSNTFLYFDVPAQVKYFNNEIIDDTLNWVKVCGLYKAHGGESFTTLGNFNTDLETIPGMVYTNGWGWQTYFFIDDVSVIPLDSIPGGIPVNAGPDQTIQYGDTAFIGERISNMPDNWFTLAGAAVDTNTAGVYVSPGVTTTYVVTRNLNGLYSTDTVTVFVLGGVGLEEKKKEEFKVFPTPNNGEFYLTGKIDIGYKLQILNLDGKVVLEESFTEKTEEILMSTSLISGAYSVVLRDKQGIEVFRNKIVVIK